MNRLKKKCIIATVGIHLLLLTILLVGPAFFNPQPKPDNSKTLTVIPANLIEAAFNSGVKDATPPPPTPISVPTPQPQVQPTPTPPPPKPVDNTPTILTEIKKVFTPEPKPTPEKEIKPSKTAPHEIKPDLTPVVRLKTPPKTSKPDNSTAINTAIKNLKSNLSSATTVDMPGNSSVAYANYGDVVVSVYHNAWTPPDGMTSDNVTVKFKVTIASDGTVISAHIIEPSGDPNVDAAVQRMLDRVTFIAAFPEGTKEKERTYPINFNATKISE